MKFERTEVFNLEGAIRGMRNPYDSWERSDSEYCYNKYSDENFDCNKCNLHKKGCNFLESYIVGKNDMSLAQRLIKAGSEHRKFLRQIMISVDITAPRYFFSELDTYKIGATANSCSTMHTIHTKPITMDMFEVDEFYGNDSIYSTIDDLEKYRNLYNRTKDIKYLRAMKQRLPESFLQKRTITMNYENILNMVHQRSTHRLSEWSVDFVKWVKTLPYAEDFFFGGDMNK